MNLRLVILKIIRHVLVSWSDRDNVGDPAPRSVEPLLYVEPRSVRCFTTGTVEHVVYSNTYN